MVDFGELWREQARLRRAPDDAAAWDGRARDEVSKFVPSDYSDEFLRLADLHEGESVLDMGCGAGALAIPCAERGHDVLAADFSPVMLRRCMAGVPADARGTVTPKLVAWDDDWAEAGIGPSSYDVAFASRSIATADMEGAILKLSRVARRKVCVTLVAGKSPRVSAPFLAALGLSSTGHLDAAFAFAIATQLGFEPEVRFIRSTRIDRFASREEAQKAYANMLRFADGVDALGGAEGLEARARAWVDAHLVDASEAPQGNPVAGVRGIHEVEAPYKLAIDVPRVFSWAFISWLV